VVLPGTPAIGGAGMNPDATLVPPPGGEGAPPPGAEQPPVDNGGAQGAGPKSPPATQKLRIIFDTDRGPIAAEDVTFDYTYEVNEGWTRIFVPMTAFTNPSERVPNQLKRLALFGDQKDAFYVGMIRFVADEVPIKPTIIGAKKMSAVVGQQFTLDCVVDAGLSAVDYVWDWGDGSQDEVKEPRASHIYVKAGTYTVTLTARDVDGLKEPGKYTCTIVAQPFADEPANPNPGEAAGGRIPGGPAIGAPGTPMPPRGPRTGGRTRVE
jgi:hypothetical protein